MDRSILLPDFMQSRAWLDYAAAIDELFSDVDKKTRLLSRLREPIHLSFEAQKKILGSQMFPQAELDRFDREFLVRSLNIIGMPFSDTSIFTDDHLFRLLQYLAKYWYTKGKGDVTQFLSYVLNSEVMVVNMWTEDYVSFLPEGHPDIGTSVVYGGTWYPTTHIQLSYDPTLLLDVGIDDVVRMVYDIGNYNLVLNSIVARLSMPVVQDNDGVNSVSEFVSSMSLSCASIVINEITIEN